MPLPSILLKNSLFSKFGEPSIATLRSSGSVVHVGANPLGTAEAENQPSTIKTSSQVNTLCTGSGATETTESTGDDGDLESYGGVCALIDIFTRQITYMHLCSRSTASMQRFAP